VPTKWSVSGVEPDKAADIARWAIGKGFKALKVKVGIDPRAMWLAFEQFARQLGRKSNWA